MHSTKSFQALQHFVVLSFPTRYYHPLLPSLRSTNKAGFLSLFEQNPDKETWQTFDHLVSFNSSSSTENTRTILTESNRYIGMFDELQLEKQQYIISDNKIDNNRKIITTMNLNNDVTGGEGITTTQAILLLNVVTIIWGSQHAIIKIVVDDTGDPSSFTLLRFGLAALLASPYTPRLLFNNSINNTTVSTYTIASSASENKNDFWTVWRWGIEMGIWMFIGFAFQAIGLEYTTAQRSGFLLYLNVKFVPFFARILYGRMISYLTWISALGAFTGTALLAGAFGPFTAASTSDVIGEVSMLTEATTTLNNNILLFMNVGDLWTIAAAMTSAMFILRLESASAAVSDSASLNAAFLWVVAILAFVWTVAVAGVDDYSSFSICMEQLTNKLGSTAIAHPLELIYLGGITTALANWIQTKAQSSLSVERASVIYAMDPVYGALFAYMLLGESLNGIQGWVGAGLITIAAATNAFFDVTSKQSMTLNVALEGFSNNTIVGESS